MKIVINGTELTPVQVTLLRAALLMYAAEMKRPNASDDDAARTVTAAYCEILEQIAVLMRQQ